MSFFCFLSARALSSLARTMLSVAVGWHLYKITGNPFDLALVGLVTVMPVILFFIPFGVLVDIFPRKTILVVCGWVDAGIAVLLTIFIQYESIERIWIFTLLFGSGAVMALYRPALDSILPNIVSEKFLQRAIAISTTVWNVAMTAGPFFAGVFIAWIDLDIYWLMAALWMISALLFFLLPAMPRIQNERWSLHQLLGGVHFIRNSPIVLGSISLDLFIVLFGSVVALLPIYATDILHVGPEALGLMRGMPALGAVLVGIIMAKLPEMRASGWVLFLALFIFSLSIFLFAFSTVLWLSVFALFLYGASDMISVNVRSTLIQLATPDALRGRVNSVNGVFISASNQFGDFRAGSVAALLPPVMTATIGGFCALVITVGGCLAFPSIRKLDRLSDVALPENK